MQYTEPNLFTALAQGQLNFAYPISPLLFAVIAVIVVMAVGLSYKNTTRPVGKGWKAFFISLRSSVLLLLLLCLLRPVIITQQASPQNTYLGVLFDDSRSMSITDMAGSVSRREAMNQQLIEKGVLEALAESFQLRSFRFDQRTEGIANADDLSASGTGSSISQALDFVDARLGGLPLAGLVLVTDGAENTGEDPVIKAKQFGTRQIPVFTVGVGQETIPRDIGIVDVHASRTVLEGAIHTISAGIHHQGYEGQRVQLAVRQGESVAASRTVTLGAAGVTQRYELELTPDRPEAMVYELEVELLDDEIIEQNNTYSFLLDNTEQQPLDILYIEGHPRNEYKFIRRAVEADSSLRLATYLQTGPEKYYRQGIKSPTELSEGFPRDRETLFAYEALILGDIEASFFDSEQLQMIQDFVAERGGGLLMSGMIAPEFITTPVSDILPVSLVREDFLSSNLRGGIRRGNHPTGQLFTPRLTTAGEFSPLLRLAAESGENHRLWGQLPQLQGVFVTGRSKPGASVLIEHPSLQYQNQALPILVYQRYGSGRSMVLTSASTWRWQMMMDAEDQSHETLWRQLLRWLAVSSPERIRIEFDREFYNVGDEVTVSATVLDRQYQPDNNASLYLQTTDPLNQITDNPMEWDIEADGVYRSRFTVAEEGIYRLLVDVASEAGEGSADGSERTAALVVTPSRREFSDASMDSGLLKRIAEASGGRYFTLPEVPQLVNAIAYTPNAYSSAVQIDLWDQPWLLALLVTLLCLDWLTRRLKGLS